MAGGGGDLAFELGVRRGIPAVVVDPRAPREPEGKVCLCTGATSLNGNAVVEASLDVVMTDEILREASPPTGSMRNCRRRK